MILSYKEKIKYLTGETLAVLLPQKFLCHPFLFVLLFFLDNITRSYETYQMQDILIVASVIFLFMLLAVMVMLLIYRDKEKAVILVSLLVIIVFFYDDIFTLSYSVLDQYFPRKNLTMGLALSLLGLIVGWSLKKINKPLRAINIFLTMVALLFIIFNLGHLAYNMAYADNLYERYLTDRPGIVSSNAKINKRSLPDIYFIVLDSYTSSESLDKYWAFNNGDFTGKLEARGFRIAQKSKNLYVNTDLSIASVLNMSPLSRDLINVPTFRRIGITNEIIKNNTVVKILEQYGYDIINYSIFNISGIPRYTSFSITYSAHEGSFAVNMFDKTIMGAFVRLWNMPDVASINLQMIDDLKRIPDEKTRGPKFVYAHLMLPHFPYQFDENGMITSANKMRYESKNKKLYLKQLKYTNTLTIDLVDKILAKSKKKPIIVIQGDHGFRMLEGHEKAEESRTILNAYYLPDKKGCSVDDNIAPVNTFRLIFNSYLGTRYGLLDEAGL